MNRHIAMPCVAIALLSSVTPASAQEKPYNPYESPYGIVLPGPWNPNYRDPPRDQTLTKIVAPYKSAPKQANKSAPKKQAKPVAAPKGAPDTQNFIQLSQPEVQPVQNVPLAPTSFSALDTQPDLASSAPDMQPDLADSEVSDDDPS